MLKLGMSALYNNVHHRQKQREEQPLQHDSGKRQMEGVPPEHDLTHGSRVQKRGTFRSLKGFVVIRFWERELYKTIYLPIYSCTHSPALYPFIYLLTLPFVHLSVFYSPIHPSIYPSIHLHICPFIHAPTHSSACLQTLPSVNPFNPLLLTYFYQSTHLCFHLSVHLLVYLSAIHSSSTQLSLQLPRQSITPCSV